MAAATFIAMIALWLIYPETRIEGKTIMDRVLEAFIMAVTIVVVAVPEGLPLAVTLSLAFSTQKMMNDNNLIRVLAACETMGNATNICSDKTGTLTQNRMTVVEAWLGGTHFKKSSEISTSTAPEILINHIVENVSINSTTVLIKPSKGGDAVIVNGSSTEGALLTMLETNWAIDYTNVRSGAFDETRGDKLFTFSSDRKCMSVYLNKPTGPVLYCKGAAEIIVGKCTSYTTMSGSSSALDADSRSAVLAIIQLMAKGTLRAIAIAHRSVEPAEVVAGAQFLERNLTLDAIYGIKDPLRPDVVEAVKRCQAAGIFVRMVTGDNVDTAKAIAMECGILTVGGLVLEGPEFRKLTPKQLDAILPKLQVLARSSPDDKHTLVTRLNGHNLPTTEEEWVEQHPECDWLTQRDLLLPGYAEEWSKSRADHGGEVVGVTGDGTNDGPALKAADVGLSMGLSGTDGKCGCIFCVKIFQILFVPPK